MENVTNEGLIRKQYSAALESDKEKLKSDYDTSIANLDNQQLLNQQATTKNIAATRADADRAAVARAEYEAASGLSSGARAQARIAADNQLAANITALRAAQQASDDEIARTRSLLGQQYASAIKRAQQNNDSALAKALYDDAKKKEEQIRSDQLAAAKLFAEQGDYTLLGQLYGLTPEQIAKLNGQQPEPEPQQNPITKNYFSQFQSADPTKSINIDSVLELGYGRITGDELNRLVKDGVVEAYEDGGEIYYRKKEQPTPRTKAADDAIRFVSTKWNRSAPQFEEQVASYIDGELAAGRLTAADVEAIIRHFDFK